MRLAFLTQLPILTKRQTPTINLLQAENQALIEEEKILVGEKKIFVEDNNARDIIMGLALTFV
jgi:hypothetical protein